MTGARELTRPFWTRRPDPRAMILARPAGAGLRLAPDLAVRRVPPALVFVIRKRGQEPPPTRRHAHQNQPARHG